ncbi:hypothetical protein [Halobacillus sp. B23F22_1]|uniref:hypothetical protein n=1 Tax=Halobacillus sp. B23F22_1 TaxID=3459514 RepID=UPI00373FB64F
MKKDFPEKKDFVYWLLILLIFISVVIAWRTTDPEMLINEISLGSTFLSILLAVVAIFFSFIQSNQNTRQSNDMIKEINNVTRQIVELNGIKDDLSVAIEKYDAALEQVDQNLEKINSEDLSKEFKSEKVENVAKDFKEVIRGVKSGRMKVDKFILEYGLIDKNYDFSEVLSGISKNRNIKAVSYKIAEENMDDQTFRSTITIFSTTGVGNEEVLQAILAEMDDTRAEFLSLWNVD